ncbi:hypothetical protein TIFTF001_012338 [Ficus carica]|uniref:Uncharacterized protein n=1 Tax=Ficus carica TaxID=3494 RepID=A0AA88AFQ4_FICCA|nr:hypothetical protein TIFTF001_012338 [Ficus carica]
MNWINSFAHGYKCIINHHEHKHSVSSVYQSRSRENDSSLTSFEYRRNADRGTAWELCTARHVQLVEAGDKRMDNTFNLDKSLSIHVVFYCTSGFVDVLVDPHQLVGKSGSGLPLLNRNAKISAFGSTACCILPSVDRFAV